MAYPGKLKLVYRRIALGSERFYFFENLTVLLSAGMDMMSALLSLKADSSKGMRFFIDLIAEEVENGSTLSASLRRLGFATDNIMALIEAGEKSGKLVDNLKIVVLQNEKELLFRSRLRSSLMYAVIVFSLTLFIGLATAWFSLPKIADLYSEMNTQLPLMTRFIMAIGFFLGKYGYLVIPIFVVIFLIILYFLFSFPRTKFIGHSLLFRTPLVRNLIKQVEIARMGIILGSMLDAGLPISQALDSLPGSTTFLNYRRFYLYLQNNVEQGASLSSSFFSYPASKKLFPESVKQMITAAERGGNLPDTLKKIGQIFEIKTEATAQNLSVILEPILLIIVGLGVAVLALSLLLPIYNLSSII